MFFHSGLSSPPPPLSYPLFEQRDALFLPSSTHQKLCSEALLSGSVLEWWSLDDPGASKCFLAEFLSSTDSVPFQFNFESWISQMSDSLQNSKVSQWLDLKVQFRHTERIFFFWSKQTNCSCLTRLRSINPQLDSNASRLLSVWKNIYKPSGDKPKISPETIGALDKKASEPSAWDAECIHTCMTIIVRAIT